MGTSVFHREIIHNQSKHRGNADGNDLTYAYKQKKAQRSCFIEDGHLHNTALFFLSVFYLFYSFLFSSFSFSLLLLILLPLLFFFIWKLELGTIKNKIARSLQFIPRGCTGFSEFSLKCYPILYCFFFHQSPVNQ